jgi:hypothetical protein
MVLPIEYADLITLFLFIFAVVGLMRGWFKEGITAIFTAALAVLVWQKDLARKIIETINDLIKLIVMFFQSGFSLKPQTLMAQAVDPDLLLDPDSYRLYVVVTVVMLAVSYVVGEATFKGKMTPLGRLLGGLIGAFNGYVILALVKQYMFDHFQTKGGVSVLANEMSVRLTAVPTGSPFAGAGLIFIFIVVIGVVALLVAGDRLKLPLK